MPEEHTWWQRGVVYHVYPRSFADADGDGVGDLRGIAGRLEHLAWLGADALWISPFYPSPMKDFGYDVSDHTGVDPLFGTMGDFERLLGEAHGRGLKVVLDFVPNHTSEEHPWFAESRSSRESPKRNWYLWRDPAPGGGPPNNWTSYFGGPAWTYDAATGQYYLNSFDPSQPDLNWREPEVREAVYGAMRFWLDRGVDGFRLDVLWLLVKDELFRDNPENLDWKEGDWPQNRQLRTYSEDRPEVHEIVREMRRLVDEYPGDRVLVGEIYLPLDRLVAYYGEDLDGVQMPYNFSLVTAREWGAKEVRALVDAYEAALPEGAWPNWVLGNHDVPRVTSRLGPERARLAQLMLLTLRGTPTLYYADEIGLPNVKVPEHLATDPQGLDNPGGFGRDPVRTPMRWTGGENAGFCPPGAEPWLPVGPDADTINVEAQKQDPDSTLMLHKRLLDLRRSMPALRSGGYAPLDGAPEGCFAYLREGDGQRALVLLNFSAEALAVDLPETEGGWKALLSTHPGGEERPERVAKLRAHEGLVLAPGGK
jgi:alpha-glucosidase